MKLYIVVTEMGHQTHYTCTDVKLKQTALLHQCPIKF